MVGLIGAPFDLCGLRLGSRLGPPALRLAGLVDALEALHLAVADRGDIAVDLEPRTEGGLRDFPPLLDAMTTLKRAVGAALAESQTPIVLGGEHTLAAATVSAALEATDGDLALLWIDAHADVNTPGSSDTGNIHGMPIAALGGLPSETDGIPDREWRSLLDLLGPVRLAQERIAWYGLRDVDPREVPRLQGLPITMHDLDRYGVEATVERFDGWMRGTGAKNLWISFDVDALDPILAPGTGTAVRGGLTYREAHLMAELLHEHLSAESCPYRLLGVDVVETNPLYDNENSTAKMAVEWIASLFGKRILGQEWSRAYGRKGFPDRSSRTGDGEPPRM